MSESPPVFQRQLLHITDPEMFVDAVSGASLQVELRRAMTEPARIDQFQGWDWAIDFSVVHVDARVRGEVPHGWATMALIRSDAGSRWAGQQVKPGTVLGNPPGVEIDGWVTPGFGWTAVSASPALWAEGGRMAGIERPPRQLILSTIDPAFYSRFEHRLDQVHRILEAAMTNSSIRVVAERQAREIVLSLISLVWDLGSSGSPLIFTYPARVRLARRAEEWMRHHLSDRVGIPEVCRALNASRRELEYAFRAAFDISPHDFLQKLRLNAIYRDLRRSSTTAPGSITDIALNHGISHLGRFPSQYRELFGELPRETLRRRLGSRRW